MVLQSSARLRLARSLPGIAFAAATVLGVIAPVATANSQESNSPVYAENTSALAASPLAQAASDQLIWPAEPLLTISDPQVSLGASDTIAISPDGMVASAVTTDPNQHADSVRVWDLTTGETLYTLSDHASMISAIAFSPDGRLLATADYDFDNRMLTIRLRDASNGRTLSTLRRAITPRFIQDGGGFYFSSVLTFSPDSQTLYSSATSPLIQVWDVNQGTLQHSLIGHRETIRALQVSPDGQTLASTHVDGRLTLLDLSSGQIKHTVTGGIDAFKVAFSADGETVTATFTVRREGSQSRQVASWNTTTGELAHSPTDFPEQDWLILSPGVKTIAAVNYEEQINLLDAITGQTLQTLDEQATNATFSPDGRLFAAVTEGNIKIWASSQTDLQTTF